MKAKLVGIRYTASLKTPSCNVLSDGTLKMLAYLTVLNDPASHPYYPRVRLPNCMRSIDVFSEAGEEKTKCSHNLVTPVF
jgi:hypothetical protein